MMDEIHTKLFVERFYEECGMQDLDMRKYTETSLFVSVMGILNENWFEKDKWDAKTQLAFEKYQSKLYEDYVACTPLFTIFCRDLQRYSVFPNLTKP